MQNVISQEKWWEILKITWHVRNNTQRNYVTFMFYVWRSGSIVPRVLVFGTWWRWLLSLIPRSLYPWAKNTHQPLDRTGPCWGSNRDCPIFQPVGSSLCWLSYSSSSLCWLSYSSSFIGWLTHQSPFNGMSVWSRILWKFTNVLMFWSIHKYRER
jgi:hypothetical protein